MKIFADTNFFTNLWLELSYSAEARALHLDLVRAGAVLPVTHLLRMEFTNALQRCVYESRKGSQAFRVSSEAALVTRALFDDELAAGLVLEWRSIQEETLEAIFETLVYRHTAKAGFRTYDVLHVASALALGCDTFWSFDLKTKKLANLEGLRTD